MTKISIVALFICITNVFDIQVCVCVCVCVGQSGLGKSTLMNTLFKSKVSRKSVQATSQEKIPKTIHIKSVSHGERRKISLILLISLFLFCTSSYIFHFIHLTLYSVYPVL